MFAITYYVGTFGGVRQATLRCDIMLEPELIGGSTRIAPDTWLRKLGKFRQEILTTPEAFAKRAEQYGLHGAQTLIAAHGKISRDSRCAVHTVLHHSPPKFWCKIRTANPNDAINIARMAGYTRPFIRSNPCN